MTLGSITPKKALGNTGTLGDAKGADPRFSDEDDNDLKSGGKSKGASGSQGAGRASGSGRGQAANSGSRSGQQQSAKSTATPATKQASRTLNRGSERSAADRITNPSTPAPASTGVRTGMS